MMTMATAMLAVLASNQVPKEPAADLFLHTERAAGVKVSFVDYHWQPVLFEAMEKGSRDVPEATRNWVIARVVLDDHPLTLGKKRLGVGNYGLVLWPNLDGKGMAVEMRRIDMREVYPDVNAMAPAPRGDTVYRAPAPIARATPLASRMVVALEEANGGVVLTWLYGDRRFSLTLTR